MKVDKLNSKKVPVVRVDEKLNQYSDKVLFPEKVEKANDMLRRIGLPKELSRRPAQ